MSYSKAQGKATQKYIKNNYDEIKIRVPKGDKIIYKTVSQRLGLSLNDFLKKAAEATALDNSFIPDELKVIFWDTDLRVLDKEQNKQYIISRCLNKGGINGYAFVMKNYTEDDIVSTLKQRRDFSPQVAKFYSDRYKVPKTDMKYYKIKEVSHWEF